MFKKDIGKISLPNWYFLTKKKEVLMNTYHFLCFLSWQDVWKQHMCNLNFRAQDWLDGFGNFKALFFRFLQIVLQYNFWLWWLLKLHKWIKSFSFEKFISIFYVKQLFCRKFANSYFFLLDQVNFSKHFKTFQKSFSCFLSTKNGVKKFLNF